MARIIIVDDSAVMRRTLSLILKEGGHEIVAEAPNGIQAFNHYENHHPDLITMDITMPLSDGLESTEKIIAKYPQAKIIMISALNQKNKVFEALKLGAKHYILKPFTPEIVLATVHSVLKS